MCISNENLDTFADILSFTSAYNHDRCDTLTIYLGLHFVVNIKMSINVLDPKLSHQPPQNIDITAGLNIV